MSIQYLLRRASILYGFNCIQVAILSHLWLLALNIFVSHTRNTIMRQFYKNHFTSLKIYPPPSVSPVTSGYPTTNCLRKGNVQLLISNTTPILLPPPSTKPILSTNFSSPALPVQLCLCVQIPLNLRQADLALYSQTSVVPRRRYQICYPHIS